MSSTVQVRIFMSVGDQPAHLLSTGHVTKDMKNWSHFSEIANELHRLAWVFENETSRRLGKRSI